MKTVRFSDVEVNSTFINPPDNDVFTKVSAHSATKDGVWEDHFVQQEPVLIEEV